MSVIAETKYGSVRGVKTTSALGTEYISFFSIPYGTPPVGQLRFKVSNRVVMVNVILNMKHMRTCPWSSPIKRVWLSQTSIEI